MGVSVLSPQSLALKRGGAVVSRKPLVLLGAALLVGLLAAMPLVYIVVRAAGAEAGTWSRLWTAGLAGLVANTVALMVAAGAFTVALGVGLAWLVERTDLPGRNVWRWVLALPLSVPAYVGALCYLIVLRRGGLVEETFVRWGWEPGTLPLPPLYTLGGAALVIGLFTFPYVYLPVAAALRSTDWTLEEAARVGGRTGFGAFREVVLPLLAPSVFAGLLLVCLYVVSDFGTVALLRYRTFTVAIYNEFAGQIERNGAAILSFVLIGLVVPLLALEGRLGGRGRGRAASWKPRRLAPLGRWRVPALALVCLVGALSLGLPVVVLGGLTLQSLLHPTQADLIWSVGGENIWRYGLNSLLVAAVAASLAVMLAFAPALLASRYPGRFTSLLSVISKAGYALPGVIAGLSLVMLFNRWAPALYGTVFALVLAFAARFLPQAIASTEAALKNTSSRLEGAARTMGRTPWQVFREVTLPMAAPGVAAGWALVFLVSMKELPMAVLLRPPGFDTLPVRIWAAASESVYTQAAPPAFLLISLTILTLGLLFSVSRFGIDEVVL